MLKKNSIPHTPFMFFRDWLKKICEANNAKVCPFTYSKAIEKTSQSTWMIAHPELRWHMITMITLKILPQIPILKHHRKE